MNNFRENFNLSIYLKIVISILPQKNVKMLSIKFGECDEYSLRKFSLSEQNLQK